MTKYEDLPVEKRQEKLYELYCKTVDIIKTLEKLEKRLDELL